VRVLENTISKAYQTILSPFLYLTMDRCPPEILAEIAAILPLRDLRVFRRTCRLFAETSVPSLTRQLRVINTVPCLLAFLDFLKHRAGGYSHQLTIYHGEWPWYELEKGVPSALRKYIHPITWAEASRTWSSNAAEFQELSEELMVDILGRLPNLCSLTVDCVRPFGQEPIRAPKMYGQSGKNWIPPTINVTTNGTINTAMRCLSQQSTLKSLRIRGRVQPYTLERYETPLGITDLRITSLVADLGGSWNFLANFSNLRHLDLSLVTWPYSVPYQHPACLPWLESLCLTGTNIDEESLVAMFNSSLKLKDVTLTNVGLLGSWYSCLMNIKMLDREIVLRLSGTVLGFDLNRARLELKGEKKLLLSPPVELEWPPDSQVTFT
jgi:hypothetical protein